MDTPQVHVSSSDNPDQSQDAITANSQEVEMGGTEAPPDSRPAPEPVNPTATEEEAALVNVPDADAEPPTPAKKARELDFRDLLASKMVEIAVGEDEHQSVINTHEVLLTASPFLSERVAKLETSGPRRISLPQENVEAFSCFLEFQYRRDYKVPSEAPTPEAGTDESGKELLHHARVYTLAEKLGLPELKSLAHKKIHMVGGTPAGELAYARYVYTHTPAEDTTIRKPIASYWASHSYRLRHSVGEDFKKMCIEVPEFSFDMLSIMLDRKEKSRESEVDSSIRGSARKRLRSEK